MPSPGGSMTQVQQNWPGPHLLQPQWEFHPFQAQWKSHLLHKDFLHYLQITSSSELLIFACHMTYVLSCSILEFFQQFVFCFYPRCSVYSINHHFHHWLYKSPFLFITFYPQQNTSILLPILSSHYNTSNAYLFIVCFLAKQALPSMHINLSVYKQNCYSSFT